MSFRTDMISSEIPKNYTLNPSSFSGTPQLTINHDVAADLDSTNAFEGPEKLLEVWFSASSTSLPTATAPAGLKVVPPEVWQEMLDLVNCKVLSVIDSEHVDAYLLSESSMFVFPHKLILKTCGTTTLLSGLPRILEIAAKIAKFPGAAANLALGTGTAAKPYRVFYSRKNFKFPDRQRGPHRSWRDEVNSLDKLFLGGSAYMIGKMNGEHWYLYLTEPNTILTPPATPERRETETKILELPGAKESLRACEGYDDTKDETLEILMTDLDKTTAEQFYLDHASAVASEGRYNELAHKARTDAAEHIGGLDGVVCKGSKPADASCGKLGDEDLDVFSNTSSDPADLMASYSEDLTYPDRFASEGHPLGTVVSESSGLADVYPISKYPEARIDAYLFQPCGFSANGVIPAPTGRDATHYFNVHVTPEPHCSYASFETNVPTKQTGRETADVIKQVVNIFKPGRFSVTLFEGNQADDDVDPEATGSQREAINKTIALQKKMAKKSSRLDQIPGYRRVERIVHDLEGYDLVFKHYVRDDWAGGSPRLGEVMHF